MTAQQESKRHHHVPRLYLKRWCDKNEKLYVFQRFQEKNKVKAEKKSTKYTGFKWDCYSLDGIEKLFPHIGKTYMEDKFFKQVDQRADDPLNEVASGNIPLISEDRSHIVIFLVALIVRNPWFFRSMRSLINGEQFKPFLKKMAELKNDVDINRLIYSDNSLDMTLVFLFEEIIINKNIIDYLINCEWSLVYNKGYRFLTSDAPVWWGGFGENIKGFFAMIAVSPSLSLVISDSSRGIDAIIDNNNICAQYNDIICKQAFDLVFSNTLNQERFINNRLGIYKDYFGLSNYKFMKFFENNRSGIYNSPIEDILERPEMKEFMSDLKHIS